MPWSFLSKFALAARTEKRRAPLLDFALDSRAATVVARLPRASVDVKPFLKGSRSTIGVAIVPKGRTAGEKRIFENVSKDAWKLWVEHMKMLMNEYRLNLGTQEAQEFLLQQMEQYFFGEGAALPPDYVAPQQK